MTTGAYLALRDTDESDTALRADDRAPTTTSRLGTTTPPDDPSTSTTTPPTSVTTTGTTGSTSGGATTGSSTTARRATTTTAAPPTTAPAPPFQSSIETVTLEQLGSSWRPGMGCPGPDQLRAVNVSHWGYDGAVHIGRLIVDAGHAQRMVTVFRDIYAARFPIGRMVPIDQYGGDDQASMRANNTSGFNCRYVSGTTKLSQHGLGRAVDVAVTAAVAHLVAGLAQGGADRGGTPILPDDRGMDGSASGALPHHHGFALVGQADRGDALAGSRFAQHRHRVIPDAFGVVLHPTVTRIVLLELALGGGHRHTGRRKSDGPGAGGALVEGEEQIHGDQAIRRVRCW